MCITPSIHSTEEKCFFPHHIRQVWIVSFVLSIGAVLLLVLSMSLLIASHYVERPTVEYGRLTGFVASECFFPSPSRRRPAFSVIFLCLSTVLFPMGFDSEIIGGSPFQLPADYRIGSSYIAFVGATWLTVLSALVTGKMCLPRFIN